MQAQAKTRVCLQFLFLLIVDDFDCSISLEQMEERMTLCNMVVEAGGKNGIVPADNTTYKYLEVSAIAYWCKIIGLSLSLSLSHTIYTHTLVKDLH